MLCHALSLMPSGNVHAARVQYLRSLQLSCRQGGISLRIEASGKASNCSHVHWGLYTFRVSIPRPHPPASACACAALCRVYHHAVCTHVLEHFALQKITKICFRHLHQITRSTDICYVCNYASMMQMREPSQHHSCVPHCRCGHRCPTRSWECPVGCFQPLTSCLRTHVDWAAVWLCPHVCPFVRAHHQYYSQPHYRKFVHLDFCEWNALGF